MSFERMIIDSENAPSVEEIMAKLNSDIVDYEFDDYCLHIEFSEEGNAFVGWINTYNEENYYFDNGSGNTEMVELKVNCCPEERMMCYDPEALKEIVLYFCETGERNPKYNWIEDPME
ncbi:MAG: hypothetical protein J6X80_05315 [Lachnospiraceae bacterium]|nr:hypothetical protein [Lachnospiraceae bacterium]